MRRMEDSLTFAGIFDKQNKESNLKKFQLNITGIYQVGTCYLSPQQQSAFKKFLVKLEANLEDVFSMQVEFLESDPYGGCARVQGVGNKSYVYLHPMEFTGYLPEKDVDALRKFTANYFDSVEGLTHPVSIYGGYMETVSNMSDEEYIKLIESKKDEILKITKDYYNTLSTVEKAIFKNIDHIWVGMIFAQTGRIKRDTDKAAYSDSDVDCSTVDRIIKEAVEKGYFDK